MYATRIELRSPDAFYFTLKCNALKKFNEPNLIFSVVRNLMKIDWQSSIESTWTLFKLKWTHSTAQHIETCLYFNNMYCNAKHNAILMQSDQISSLSTWWWFWARWPHVIPGYRYCVVSMPACYRISSTENIFFSLVGQIQFYFYLSFSFEWCHFRYWSNWLLRFVINIIWSVVTPCVMGPLTTCDIKPEKNT